MKLKHNLACIALGAASISSMFAQTSFTSVSANSSWNGFRWNNSADAEPYTSSFIANNNVSFTSGNYTFAGMGAAVPVGNVTVAAGANVTFASTNGTFATSGNVRTFDIAGGSVFDFNGNNISTATGTGFIKNGAGTLATGAWGGSGSFTLNAGTVIARGETGMGTGASNSLILNGGTVASNASRNFSASRFGSGIVIGGNVQFGEFSTNVALANDSASLTFASNVSLGSAVRTLTLGNNGSQTFSGVISNTSGGLTFAANAGTGSGRFDITNNGNTFTGPININGVEVRFTADGSLGNATNSITLDGGRFFTTGSGFTVGASRQISVGDGPGNVFNITGSSVLVYNGTIADKAGEIGSWAKDGTGVFELGGASTYTGNTEIRRGTVRLTNGDNRLPTTTVLSLGQSNNATLGTLDLNGRNQELAGLQSIAGTSTSPTTNNTVTSAAPATLTINSTANFIYGNGTTQNSGVITGAISFVKLGAGTQTLGGNNTYNGSTRVGGGTLLLSSTGRLNNTSGTTIESGAAIGGNGTIAAGGLRLDSGARFVFSLTDTLKIESGTVSFGGFGISDVIGLDETVPEGTFALMGGPATFDYSNLVNVGIENAVSLAPGKVAYFETTSGVTIIVIPEPHEYAVLIVSLLGVVLMIRCLRGRRMARRHS